MVSSPSVSKLELWNLIYVCHCMWPFIDLTHCPKRGAKHLHGTKDFIWCRKVMEAAPHIWALDRNLSGSKKQNHTLYLLKLWWLMRGFMVRGRHRSVYQSINILLLLQHVPAVPYLPVEETVTPHPKESGIWWKSPGNLNATVAVVSCGTLLWFCWQVIPTCLPHEEVLYKG